MTAVATWWNPPPAPLDIWAQVRAQAPDTADHTARHRRGYVQLPYDLGGEGLRHAGDLVPAWVCCDPTCGGVELGEYVLELNHDCCEVIRFVGQRGSRRGQHMADYGRVYATGYYHGPYTPYWQPNQA